MEKFRHLTYPEAMGGKPAQVILPISTPIRENLSHIVPQLTDFSERQYLMVDPYRLADGARLPGFFAHVRDIHLTIGDILTLALTQSDVEEVPGKIEKGEVEEKQTHRRQPLRLPRRSPFNREQANQVYRNLLSQKIPEDEAIKKARIAGYYAFPYRTLQISEQIQLHFQSPPEKKEVLKERIISPDMMEKGITIFLMRSRQGPSDKLEVLKQSDIQQTIGTLLYRQFLNCKPELNGVTLDKWFGTIISTRDNSFIDRISRGDDPELFAQGRNAINLLHTKAVGQYVIPVVFLQTAPALFSTAREQQSNLILLIKQALSFWKNCVLVNHTDMPYFDDNVFAEYPSGQFLELFVQPETTYDALQALIDHTLNYAEPSTFKEEVSDYK